MAVRLWRNLEGAVCPECSDIHPFMTRNCIPLHYEVDDHWCQDDFEYPISLHLREDWKRPESVCDNMGIEHDKKYLTGKLLMSNPPRIKWVCKRCQKYGSTSTKDMSKNQLTHS
jgi:hypothetical protein